MSDTSTSTDSCIAIVGAGKGGSAILDVLLHIQGVKVKYICDPDPKAEGIRIAAKNGITCISELYDSEIVTDKSLNLIFEATGKEEVFNYIQQHVDTNCTVIGAAGARVIYYLLDSQQKISNELQHCKMILSEKVMERTEELENSNIELQHQINEYQELNLKLQQVNDEKTKYLVNATHQLKAPFAAIQSYTELLLDGYADSLSEKAEAIVKRMKDRCMLLSRSIKEMLELANLNSFVEDNLQMKEENLNEIAAQVITSLKPVLKRENMHLNFQPSKSGNRILCNRKQIEALVQILLENAVNYSESDTQIDLLIQENETGRISLIVADRGIGIDEKNLKNIFKEYFRTNRGVKKSYNGSGLGLAIAKR